MKINALEHNFAQLNYCLVLIWPK